MDPINQAGYVALQNFQIFSPTYYSRLVSIVQSSPLLAQEINNYGASVGPIAIVSGTQMSTEVPDPGSSTPLGQIQVGEDNINKAFGGGLGYSPLAFATGLAHELANSSQIITDYGDRLR